MSTHPFSQEEIIQFFEGSLPDLQHTEVLKWFSSLTIDEQTEFMDFHFDSIEKTAHGQAPTNPAGFKKLEAQILIKNQTKVKAVQWVLRIAAAALPFIVGYLMFMQPANLPKVSPAQNATICIRNIEISNPLKDLKTVQLPDSSSVDLYPGATLSYPEGLAGKKRKLLLSGKAFFKVKHDEQRPFIVQSGAVTTVVLGTSFWIDAVSDSKTISVKVKTGKVGVIHGKHPALFLLPSEKAVFNTLSNVLTKVKTPVSKSSNVLPKDLPSAVVFNQTPLRQVIKALAENFNVQIDMEESINTEQPISLTTRDKTIAEVLQEIKSQIPIDYEIKDKKINIKKQE